MIKRFFILLLAIVASVGMSYATDPIVIATNTEQSSYTQGSITISVNYVGDSDGFRLNNDNSASISNSGSSTISKIELVPGWFLNKHSYVRANGAEPNSSSEELITFLNVNSNEVTLSCSVSICIKEVRIYFGEAAPAKLSGAFTVNSGGDQVYFSKGNLQATTTDLGANWTWGFAANQYDCVGNVVANNSINGNGTVSANGTVDMFGWSTSANYYGINNSQDGTDYAGDFKDWGETIGDGWRTLTFAEWRYLLDYRAGTRYCKATVNSKTGLVIFPDNYSHPAGVTDVASANTKNADFATNSWSGDDWTNMETAGAVFLPMAGCRFGTSFMFQSTNGFYWSSTPNGDDQIYRLNFKSSDMDPSSWYARYGGMFVRLVYEAPAPANSCGGGLTWELNNGELVISYDGEGTGVMNDYDIPNDNLAPWYANRENITSVSLPEGIKTIGKDAFRDCVNLTTVTIPNSVTTIGESAFVTVEHLETVTIGTGITSIVGGAFYGNAELTTVTCSATTPPSIGMMVFGSCPNLEHTYVPAASVDAYKTAWSDYASLISAAGGGSEPGDEGKLPGAFTINADGDKIVFSKGNLQATTTDLGANWTWDFAPNQWSLIGNAVANTAINGNKKVSANGTIDLFGWSTAATYYGINNSWNVDDYTGDFVDWGALMGTEWRTLSRAEFYYIVYSRTDAYKKRGQATVNGVPGYVLLPDAWTLPSGLSFTYNAGNYTTNQYDGADWTAMESAGAVFLPAAGVREGTDIYQVNLYGWYWASTPNDEDGGKAYYLWFDKSSQGVTEYYRWKSKSVRLVTEAPIPPYEAAIKLINAIGTVELTAECKAKIDAARAAFIALSDGDKAQVTNYSTLQQAEAAYTALNQAEADKVIAKIAAIPTPVELKLATRDSIESARAAYDALTAEQKLLVPAADLQKLTDAEAALAALNPGGAQTGAVNGKFSISNGNQIAFSKGNLQYQASTGTWRFAANQYDAIGDDNSNISPTYTGWIDLFGWGTGSNPTITSTNNDDYTIFVDWGDNAISNGGNEANLWRTLTNNEWKYLFQTRTDAASKYGIATVADVHGLIILPDDYAGTAISTGSGSWDKNTISAEDWAAYEAKGAVFLPTTGYRYGTTVNGVDARANYWSSTFYMDGNAYDLGIEAGYVYTQDQYPCGRGFPVRLVTENAGSPAPLDSAQAVKDLIDAIPVPVTLDAACVNAVQAARDAYNALSDSLITRH